MIEINLSLVFVMLCFWVTLWLVHRFLIQPVGGVIDERRRRIDGAQQEWSAKNDEYTAAIARVEEDLTTAAQEAASVRTDARQHAMDERQQTLDAARQSADARLGSALEALEQEAGAARDELRRRAEELSRLLAGRVLGREVRG
jgi:F-type H+-transporting ATPase subunit b